MSERIKRDHLQRQIAQLDPETDFEEISRLVSYHEFPWDIQQSLSFALFRTYAVPSIGQLLYDTGEFTTNTQRLHDDTALVLESVLDEGMESPKGRSAVRRMNQMHGSYDISNNDMRYVLATFVVIPQRWIRDYGWRRGTEIEKLASVRYYQRMGQLMGITDIPADFEEFEELLNAYEVEHFGYDDKARAVADATLKLLVSFYPRIFAKGTNLFSRALMDAHLLNAFGYKVPSRPVVWIARASLRMRGRVVRFMPARRTPLHANELKRVKSYPGGFIVERLGTFPSTERGTAGSKGTEMRDRSAIS